MYVSSVHAIWVRYGGKASFISISADQVGEIIGQLSYSLYSNGYTPLT